MNAAFLSAMTLTTEGVALWLQYSAPVWVFLAGVLLFKEQPTYRDRWMIVGVIGGVTLILLGQWSDAQRYPSNLAGAAWGTVSGIALAGVFLSLRRISHLDPLWVVALCHGAAALILAPFVLGQTALPTPAQLLWLVAFGGLQMGLPYVLFTRGLRTIPTHEASCLALLEPMLVCLWVYLVWGNAPEYRPPDAWTLVGGASILVGLGVRYAYPD
jgi:drug/metabolite transporter (DMT)-like permease